MSDAKSPPELSMDEILATIRRIIAEDEHTAAPTMSDRSRSDIPSSGGQHAGEEPLELTEALNDDGSIRHIAPLAAAMPSGGGTSEPASAASTAIVEPITTPPHHEVPSLNAAEDIGAAKDNLVSEVASLAAASAFARLGTVPREPRAEPELRLSADGRTLEDIVRDLLRPLLQSWLDENLPQIVERLVAIEIARVVGKSGVR
jgi:hypothetical protein